MAAKNAREAAAAARPRASATGVALPRKYNGLDQNFSRRRAAFHVATATPPHPRSRFCGGALRGCSLSATSSALTHVAVSRLHVHLRRCVVLACMPSAPRQLPKVTFESLQRAHETAVTPYAHLMRWESLARNKALL